MPINGTLNRARLELPFVDDHGHLTPHGFHVMDQLWRQVAPGFTVVPCTATGTNIITLTTNLTSEGAAQYINYMVFAAVAANTSTGAVTGLVTDGTNPLATIKVYKAPGTVQANNGDIVKGGLYLFTYNSALDSAAGGLVAK